MFDFLALDFPNTYCMERLELSSLYGYALSYNLTIFLFHRSSSSSGSDTDDSSSSSYSSSGTTSGKKSSRKETDEINTLFLKVSGLASRPGQLYIVLIHISDLLSVFRTNPARWFIL